MLNYSTSGYGELQGYLTSVDMVTVKSTWFEDMVQEGWYRYGEVQGYLTFIHMVKYKSSWYYLK